MTDPITMTSAQYEQLLKHGQQDDFATLDERTAFLQLRKTIDLANNVRRYTLAIRYTGAPESNAGFTLSADVIVRVAEFSRPPTKEDILKLIENDRAVPGSIYVSADPNAILGFYELDKFPWQ